MPVCMLRTSIIINIRGVATAYTVASHTSTHIYVPRRSAVEGSSRALQRCIAYTRYRSGSPVSHADCTQCQDRLRAAEGILTRQHGAAVNREDELGARTRSVECVPGYVYSNTVRGPDY